MTLDLLDRYSDWLAIEYGETLIERNGIAHSKDLADSIAIMRFRRECCRENPTLNQRGGRREMPPAAAPSTRAAVVLSVVGCDWREDRS